MPFLRSAARWTGRGVVIGGIAFTGLLSVPIETLPSPLVPTRVGCEGLVRVGRCTATCIRMLYAYKIRLYGVEDQEEWDKVHVECAEMLCSLCENNGGGYVKMGQAIAAANNVMPDAYCEELLKLQDAVKPRNLAKMIRVVEDDLGKPIDELFMFISENPIAAASIAQVHEAVIKGTNQKVAVKIQYYDAQRRFKGDMTTIQWFLKASSLFAPGLDYSDVMAQTEDIMQAELDFSKEAANGDQCRMDLQQRFGDSVTTPEIVPSHCGPRVLTTEFIDNACKVNDQQGIKSLGFTPRQVAELYVAAFSYQLFHCKTFHCDPHPGNVFVRKHPKDPKKLQLVVLDHGLYAAMSAQERLALAQCWSAAARKDDVALQTACKKLGIDEYKLFATILLAYPYDISQFAAANKSDAEDSTSTGTTQQSRASEKKMLQTHFESIMEEMNEMMNGISVSLNFALMQIDMVRSIVVDLGNPLPSRALTVLPYAMDCEGGDQESSNGTGKRHSWRYYMRYSTASVHLLWQEFLTRLFGFLFRQPQQVAAA